ncbi:MAG TPA: carbonic anhydrase [Thermoanaerobaculia bacterium]|nr:carbonic anhydrase [Thermoanaerobaculia bacterium]
MKYLPRLFENNARWASRITSSDPHFFERLSAIQRPEYLWIGCSDSRVPASHIVGLDPGEMFVHRNIANIVVPTDPNCMAVLEFAINTLEVDHVIVCGHYNCGGVRAALEGNASGFVGEWLTPLVQFSRRKPELLDETEAFDSRWAKLCEMNVMKQVETLTRTDVVRNAWKMKRRVTLHGWIYSLRDGLLRDLGVSVAQA